MTEEELVNEFFAIMAEHNLENVIYVHYNTATPTNTELFSYLGTIPQIKAKVYLIND